MKARTFRRSKVRMRGCLLLAASILSVGMAASWCQTDKIDDRALNQKRIEPDHVTIANRQIFQEQLRQDLPVGTSKKEVEAYLTRRGITHSLVRRGAPVDANTFYAIIKNIGPAGAFVASLAIRIQLDDDDKVQRIWFRVDYL